MTIRKSATMGEITTAAQGYPTQVWAPVGVDNPRQRTLALIHDRYFTHSDDSDTFFIPGNDPKKLLLPGTESHDVLLDGAVRRLRIPDAVLWSNHGGPCERRGARYRRIGDHVMKSIYDVLHKGQADKVIIPKRVLETNYDYIGPFDYELLDESGKPVQLLKLEPMSTDVLDRYF